jgi:hypothetical protein
VELLGSSPIPRSFVASCVSFQLRPLPSTGITRLRRYNGPLRHPSQPGLSLTSCRLIHTAITAGTSRVASDPLYLYAVATTPAGSMETVRSYLPIVIGLPRISGGSAPASPFSRPAQRSPCYGLQICQVACATFCTEGFSSFVASAAASIATGWNEQVPGRVTHPLWISAFSRRTEISGLALATCDSKPSIGLLGACKPPYYSVLPHPFPELS